MKIKNDNARKLAKKLSLQNGYYQLSKDWIEYFKEIEIPVFLSYLTSQEEFLFKKKGKPIGFFFSTVKQIRKKCGIKRHTLEKAIKRLEEEKLIETKLKGVPAKRYFKINYENIILMQKKAIADFSNTVCRNQQTVCRNQQTNVYNNKLKHKTRSGILSKDNINDAKKQASYGYSPYKGKLTGVFIRDIILIWNTFPNVTKHNLLKNKTTNLIKKYLKELEEGTFMADKKLSKEYQHKHKLTPDILNKRFLKEEIIKTMKRLRKYYSDGYSPLDKKYLPKSLDKVFYNGPNSWNNTKDFSSWFLVAYANKPIEQDQDPNNATIKYPIVYSRFKELFPLELRSDIIDFNRNVKELSDFHKDDINKFIFPTFQSLAEYYTNWLLNGNGRSYANPKYMNPRILKQNSWIFLRFVDDWGRNDHVGEIIKGRIYDPHGDDNYYYGNRKP